MKRKNVVVYSLFPETAPDKVEVWQQGGGNKKVKKMRDRSKYKRCENCLFWHVDDDENGTCEVMDIITAGTQSACIDWRSKETGKQ